MTLTTADHLLSELRPKQTVPHEDPYLHALALAVYADLPVLREVLGPAVAYAAGPADLARHLLAALHTDRNEPAAAGRRAAGQALAAAHTWDAAASRHLTLYRRLIEQGVPVGT